MPRYFTLRWKLVTSQPSDLDVWDWMVWAHQRNPSLCGSFLCGNRHGFLRLQLYPTLPYCPAQVFKDWVNLWATDSPVILIQNHAPQNDVFPWKQSFISTAVSLVNVVLIPSLMKFHHHDNYKKKKAYAFKSKYTGAWFWTIAVCFQKTSLQSS